MIFGWHHRLGGLVIGDALYFTQVLRIWIMEVAWELSRSTEHVDRESLIVSELVNESFFQT